jgi:hypothetical protein
MAERPEFQQKQYEFAAHIRDPRNAPAPGGVEDRRMAIYRDLFFNNLRSLLSNMFPVLKKLHSPEQWNVLVREFMKRHRAETPYFLQLPKEFIGFLENEYSPQEDDFPFLIELAHYEYIELALSISKAENDLRNIDPDGDLLANIPVKSELTWVFAYHYPVHRIASDFLPDAPAEEPVYLAVFRQADDKVRFLELNAVSAALLDAVAANKDNLSGEELLRVLAKQIDFPDTEALIQHGKGALDEMRQLGIVIGTRAVAEGAVT